MTNYVLYNGLSMVPDWPAQIEAAQEQPYVTVDKRTYQRIPWGMEECWDTDFPRPTVPCRDCGVLPGQYHVPTCCLERCPICRDGQWLICQEQCEGATA
jgi:hypothetical protein